VLLLLLLLLLLLFVFHPFVPEKTSDTGFYLWDALLVIKSTT